MARNKKTSDYLNELKNKGYNRYNKLLNLYDKWKKGVDIKALSNFLSIIYDERKILNKHISISYLRGIAFEEFCFDVVDKTIKECNVENAVELFWNIKIITEEFYIFENKVFKKYPKHKGMDIVIGKRENNLIHPLIIISCKIWQSAPWLDEDRAVFDNIRKRYPNVLGYSLCTELSAKSISLISSQRTGLRVFDLIKGDELNEFISDIKAVLMEIKKNAR